MLPSLFPDFALMLLAFVVLAADLIRMKRGDSLPFHLTWLGLLAILASTFLVAPLDQPWLGTWTVTAPGLWLRRAFLLSTLLATLLSRAYFTRGGDAQQPLRNAPEFLASLLFINFGMHTVVAGSDLLTIFVGLELATIPLYFLAAWRREDNLGTEAATKYVLMGVAATAFMVFSFSYLYGLSGSLFLNVIADYAANNPTNPMLWLGVILLFAGIGFKLTLFPFHMWAPDVYHGAPTPTTAFLSVSSKAIAISFLMIMVYGPLAALHDKLQFLILILAGFTMTAGNLGALRQSHLRRFMAYSSIAQAGYILTALAGPGPSATGSVIYYIFLYAATNYATFFLISIIGKDRGESIVSLRGLSKQSPALAGALALCMFSLAGIPPVAGFTGKLFLFASAATTGHYAFIVFASLNSTVSLFYYLLILKEAYIEKPVTEELSELKVDTTQKIALVVLLAAVLLLGLLPQLSSAISKSVGGAF